jgi:hypothetical protein
MKKFAILGLVALGMVSALTAQENSGGGHFGIGVYGRYVFAPIGVEGTVGESLTKDNLYTNGASHVKFPPGGKIALISFGATEHLGFNLDISYMAGGIEIGDEAQVWTKFNDTLTIHGGYILGNALFGKIGGGKLVTMDEENEIFTQFHPGSGLLVDFTPVKNLYIGASVDAGKDLLPDFFKKSSVNAGYQVGAGYLFENIGHLRFQYLQNHSEFSGEKYVQGAFALTAIDGLTVEVGGMVPVEKTDLSFTRGTVAAQYTVDKFSLMGRVSTSFYEDDHQLKAGSVIKYNLNTPLFLALEASYTSDDPLTPVEDGKIQVAPYVGFRFGPGEFRAGLYGEMVFGGDKPAYKIEIPLLIEIALF